MDFGKGTRFWHQFSFLRSATGSDGQLILPHPEAFDDFSVEIATYDNLGTHAKNGGCHGRWICRSFQESIHLLDGDGRVAATLKPTVGLEQRDNLFKAESDLDADSIVETLLKLPRAVAATIRYFVVISQDYSTGSEWEGSEASIEVLLVPSKEALFGWMDLFEADQKRKASGK
jgi:hypothetical protein